MRNDTGLYQDNGCKDQENHSDLQIVDKGHTNSRLLDMNGTENRDKRVLRMISGISNGATAGE